MSIKKKIIILFVAMIILNFIGIMTYSLFLLPSEITSQVRDMKNEVSNTIDTVVSQLKYSDDFYKSVDKSKINKNMIISIEDVDGNEVFLFPNKEAVNMLEDDSNIYLIDSEKFLSSNCNGQQIYYIKAAYTMQDNVSFPFMPSFTANYVQRVIIFECFFFFVSTIILILAINRIILIPLDNLSKSIQNFNRNARKDSDIKGDEILALHNDFDSLTGALEEEEMKQTRIIASISHDIKTPLTSIMGYAEQLKKEDLQKERHEKYVRTIYEKSIAIKKMIEGLDDYLDYNDKSNESDRTAVPIKQLLSAVYSYYGDDLERENIEFNIIDNSGNTVCVINKANMLRVFGNVINNSIKHKAIDSLKILIEAYQANDEMYFKISDNGEGVSEEKLEKIFEPLYTTDESRSKAVSGLGLSICKDIIEAHGGKIFADKSSFDTGLAIYFTLPIANER